MVVGQEAHFQHLSTEVTGCFCPAVVWIDALEVGTRRLVDYSRSSADAILRLGALMFNVRGAPNSMDPKRWAYPRLDILNPDNRKLYADWLSQTWPNLATYCLVLQHQPRARHLSSRRSAGHRKTPIAASGCMRVHAAACGCVGWCFGGGPGLDADRDLAFGPHPDQSSQH